MTGTAERLDQLRRRRRIQHWFALSAIFLHDSKAELYTDQFI